ncbi:MAG: DNA primase DnaG [Candidatus Woesearchaeota archaeon]|nr:DNA primase DnaG [Candidatus Woesearchaeota archaeon]
MGKISPVSAKYIIHATISIEGVVDRPDVIGAVFGQTEGLLGADLELRELQRSGRIGRIEVAYDTKGGKTYGSVQIPSSLDKAETAIVAASLEVIQRIGPCDAKITVNKIEDVRISKRKFIVERAKELLHNWMETSMPDSQELSEEVTHSVRVMEVQEYGKDRLPAGPAIDESDEIILVEGRADVLNLLKYGIKNAIAMNGTNMPQTAIDLSKQKTVTLFVDGDRGGDLIIKGMMGVAEIDFVAKAPDGKEVEEITQKEILKALRGRIAVEQAKLDTNGTEEQQQVERQHQGENAYEEYRKERTSRDSRDNRDSRDSRDFDRRRNGNSRDSRDSRDMRGRMPSNNIRMPPRREEQPSPKLSPEQSATFKQTAEELVGTRGACIFDEKMNVLGKVPMTELYGTLNNINSGIESIVFDGSIEPELVRLAEKANVKILVGMDSKVRPGESRIKIATIAEL